MPSMFMEVQPNVYPLKCEHKHQCQHATINTAVINQYLATFSSTHTKVTSNKTKAFQHDSSIYSKQSVSGYLYELHLEAAVNMVTFNPPHQDLTHSHLIVWKYKTTDYIFVQVELRVPSFQVLRGSFSGIRENSVETMQTIICLLKEFRRRHCRNMPPICLLTKLPFPSENPKRHGPSLLCTTLFNLAHFVNQALYIFYSLKKHTHKVGNFRKGRQLFSESGGRKGLETIERYSSSRNT